MNTTFQEETQHIALWLGDSALNTNIQNNQEQNKKTCSFDKRLGSLGESLACTDDFTISSSVLSLQ